MPFKLSAGFRMLPRRLQFVLVLTVLVLFGIFFLGTSNTHDFDPLLNKVPELGPHLQTGVHHAIEVAQNVVDHVPNILGPSAHTPPPEQANSSSGEARWYSDLKWKNSFSDSITFDEERSVLPPLANRPPIYTYFEFKNRRKDEKSKKAEHLILMAWRRAWWAAGFKPVILTSAEATRHPLHKTMQSLELQAEMQQEIMRWLAWGSMGTGILVNWLAFPMSRYDDPVLDFLRRGTYTELVQYEDLEGGVYVGSKEKIDAALQEALGSRAIKSVRSMYEALQHENLILKQSNGAIAFYSPKAIKAKYAIIKKKLEDVSTESEALSMLPDLINSHLHTNWQNSFPKGIAVLKPEPDRASILIEPAMAIAQNLSHCPYNPVPASCPPNRARCEPCISNMFPIKTPSVYRNDSDIFTIGTLPHPYTATSLLKAKDVIDLSFIRRETTRDPWIRLVTNELRGSGVSAYARLPSLKDAVASEQGNARSIWLTAERPFQKDSSKVLAELDWLVGFEIRRSPAQSGESNAPVPGRAPRPNHGHEFGDGPKLDAEQLKVQKRLLEGARSQFSARTTKFAEDQRDDGFAHVRQIVEGWNLADTEAWKFVRAFNARQLLERKKWQEEEEAFLGKGVFDRWKDMII